MPPKNNDHFLDAVQNRVWALHPGKLEEVAVFIEKRLSAQTIDFPEAAKGKGGDKADDRYEVRDGVAILPVYGVLSKRINMMAMISGGSSTEILARNFKAALNDREVESILLDIDSPGGTIDGLKDLSDLIYASREQKPIVAYANGIMASAAYWIGSAAHKIVGSETAEIGSIGVALIHYDLSARDEKSGVKRTVIVGGKYKRIASDERPLSEEGAEYLQAFVDDYYTLFLEAVARNRGSDTEMVHEKMADGRIFIGKKALSPGLVDKIGNLDSALALSQQIGGVMDLKTLKEKHPDLVVQIEEAAVANIATYDDGREEGIKAERLRIVEIMEAEADPVETEKVIKDGTLAADAYKQFFAAEKGKKAKGLEQMETDAQTPLGQHEEELPGKDFMTLVAEYRKDNKCGVEVAMKAIIKSDPESQKAYLAKHNKK